MLCEECGVRPANISVSFSVEGELQTRHLCGACAQKMGVTLSEPSPQELQNLVGALISSFQQGRLKAQNAQASSAQNLPKITCPECGLSYEQYAKCGHLGCENCYVAFREPLRNVLQRPEGKVLCFEHQPLSQDLQKECEEIVALNDLRRLLKEAVEAEKFEQAAEYRDEIRTLIAQRGDSGER